MPLLKTKKKEGLTKWIMKKIKIKEKGKKKLKQNLK